MLLFAQGTKVKIDIYCLPIFWSDLQKGTTLSFFSECDLLKIRGAILKLQINYAQVIKNTPFCSIITWLDKLYIDTSTRED